MIAKFIIHTGCHIVMFICLGVHALNVKSTHYNLDQDQGGVLNQKYFTQGQSEYSIYKYSV